MDLVLLYHLYMISGPMTLFLLGLGCCVFAFVCLFVFFFPE